VLDAAVGAVSGAHDQSQADQLVREACDRRRVHVHVRRQLRDALPVAFVELVEEAKLLQRQPEILPLVHARRIHCRQCPCAQHDRLRGELLDMIGDLSCCNLHADLADGADAMFGISIAI